MDSLRTDSPLTRRVVRSFLQFLSSVQAAPGVDSEGIEVAAQCLSEVFKLNQQHDGDNNSPLPSLPDLFKLHTSSSSSGLLVQPQASSDRVMADAAVDAPMPECRSSPPPSSSSLDSPAFGFNENVANINVVKASKPTLFVLYTYLWEQFRDGLEVCGYFGEMPEGSPEHAARMKAAETTFENSLKKFRCSTTEQKDAQIVAEAFKVQGNASMKEQRFMEAIQFYTLAISLCGNNAIFYANRAAAHSEVNKFAEAIADCENAIRIDPKYSKAYSRLGWVYHAQGRFQEAIEKGFQKALDLDPNNATAKENLMAAQQKLAEQRRGQLHQQQEPEQQSQNPFSQGGIPGFGGAMPGNVQLPPEMANLVSGIMNLAAQYSQRQQQQENNTQFGAAAGDESPENGVEHDDDDDAAATDDDDIQIDTSINFTVNGQELPPEIAGLMGSVLQMFSGVNGAPAGSNHPTTPDPPGGAI
ncbi:unnamed protein product [Sphagnum jensenii]|uniref:SGTA homodimerisation domain-containing protein n=1 Tax=Sphagnum jensenii TaxID=128206 RepID=A0ABP0X3F8_9BRYO